jgi:hypothetical protein
VADESKTTGSLHSEMPVSEDPSHPFVSVDAWAALTWACEEADRLAHLINKAGLYITNVEIRLPSVDRRRLSVMVAGEEPRA